MLVTPRRGGRVVRLVLGLWALSTCMARPVRAADMPWLDEIKLGVLAHDTGLLGLAHQRRTRGRCQPGGRMAHPLLPQNPLGAAPASRGLGQYGRCDRL